MAARPKPIQKFGQYLLLKELESDAFGQTWRAARIDGAEIAATVVLRRLTGGDRDASRAAVEAAAPLLPQIAGNAVAREQRVAVIDTVPVLEFEYMTGRSLRTILDRARGGNGSNPNPIPPDQVLAIADKILASLDAVYSLKSERGRLFHGALVPQFIWISDSGDVRVAGQLLGPALLRGLATPAVAQQFAPYVAPEVRATGEPTKSSEVYAAGAILYAMLTGQEPPDASSREAFDLALARPISAASKAPLADDLRPIVQKALAIDPTHRYPSVAEFHQDVTKLLASGRYAPTTFNLAFYLHTLLKKDLEAEPAEREREAKINVGRYLEEESEPAPPPTPMFQQQAEEAAKPKSKMRLIAAILAIVVAGGAFAVWKFVLSGPAPVKTAAAPVATEATKAAALPIVEPIVTTTDPTAALTTTDTAATATTTDTTATAALDPEAAKKQMIEEEITRRYQMELLKMQADADKQRQAEEARKPAAATTAAASPAETQRELPAAALDQARRTQSPPQLPPPTATVATTTQAPATTTIAPVQQQPVQQPVQQPPTPAPAATAAVREGDIVSIGDVDQMPRALQTRKPTYPPMAMRQKITAQVVVSVLVSENGTVLDTKILRGEQRKMGFNEAAINAARGFTFVPAQKDGKRVRTWVPIPFDFKIQ
ncbi:MAG: TonB family protein [Thermoanaerobaculia bacterium]